MSKLNPGSNRHEDNDVATTSPGSLDIPEPKLLEKGKYQCTMCARVFNSREDYDSHALARHQPEPGKWQSAQSTTVI